MVSRESRSRRCRLMFLTARRSVHRRLMPGFTLVELLVVISILVVLMAILLPSLNRAREMGRRAACMGHMRQMQIAWHGYAVDHGDYIVNGQISPRSVEDGGNYGTPWLSRTGWAGKGQAGADACMRTGALAPYIGDVHAYLCPSRYRHVGINIPEWMSSYDVVPSMNNCPPKTWEEVDRSLRARYNIGRTVLYVRRICELVDPGPASRAVFVDWGSAYFQPLAPITERWSPGGVYNVPFHGAPIHHSEGSCLSFADGHVEYWKWSQEDVVRYGHYFIEKNLLNLDPPEQPLPKPDGPDYVRAFTAIWGRWPVPLDGKVTR